MWLLTEFFFRTMAVSNVPKFESRKNYNDCAFAAGNFLLLKNIDIDQDDGLLTDTYHKETKAK